MTVLLWIVVVLLFAVGVLGTILPAIPGTTLVFGGIVLAAWIDGFTRIPVWLVVVLDRVHHRLRRNRHRHNSKPAATRCAAGSCEADTARSALPPALTSCFAPPCIRPSP